MEKQIDDLFFDTGAKAAGKLKVVTKWGGHLLTLAANAFENYDEFKGQEGMESRMVAETVLETATDIGLGMAATAVLASVGAPAVAAGVIGVGVVWVGNEVCKWMTGGDDIGEVVSNLVCDGYEGVKKGFNSMVQWGKSFFGFG